MYERHRAVQLGNAPWDKVRRSGLGLRGVQVCGERDSREHQEAEGSSTLFSDRESVCNFGMDGPSDVFS